MIIIFATLFSSAPARVAFPLVDSVRDLPVVDFHCLSIQEQHLIADFLQFFDSKSKRILSSLALILFDSQFRTWTFRVDDEIYEIEKFYRTDFSDVSKDKNVAIADVNDS